ncbi:SEC-C domain-containing protein [Agrobacterium rhizogenes]|uniref:YecA family protein n=1 Tax=Rhizobium rhizogenes TaxID=359 RepID=UPI001573E714|nr:SEC-C domain-containing protein [Rhizobium rhizogenes]NTH27776.1 SEC-C domain-containing protein [Rhizobium rhizogenes]
MHSALADEEACPCRSGRLYRQCHGHYLKHLDLLSGASRPLEDLMRNGNPQELLATSVRRIHGYGRPIESWASGEKRSVRVNRTILTSKSWQTFPDFLMGHTMFCFGKEWWNQELAKLDIERHPVVAQAELIRATANAGELNRNGLVNIQPTGPMLSFLGLAYDLYLCAHNEEIPAELMRRLKDPGQFEGALYEAFVTSIFARAGFGIVFEDERDLSRRHCEFTAINRGTGFKFSVEAKAVSSSSARAGRSDLQPPIKSKLHDALKKAADRPRIIFIEVNRSIGGSGSPAWLKSFYEQIDDAEKTLTIDKLPAPAAYVFVTNRPLIIEGLGPGGEHFEAAYTGFKINDFPPDRAPDMLRLHKARMRHLEAYQLLQAVQSLTVIPMTFSNDPFVLLFQGLENEKARGPVPRHPLELFDFVFQTYIRSSRDNLMEWLSEHYPRTELEKLSQIDLAELYSAGISASMWREFGPARGQG